MKLVIQRVASASVTVEGRPVSAIKQGLCVLVGIAQNDTIADAMWAARKLSTIRLFGDEKKSWSKSLVDINGELLLVSQFTLCFVLKGNKPDFHNAMKGPEAKVLFDKIVADFGMLHKPDKVQTGEFGAHMNVGIDNDGPVTIVLDTKDYGEREGANNNNNNSKKIKGASTPSTPTTPATTVVKGTTAPADDKAAAAVTEAPPAPSSSSAPTPDTAN